MLKTKECCYVEKEMLNRVTAGAAGQYIGGSGGDAGARGLRQDVIVNMPTVYDPNQVLACSSEFGKVWAGTSALHVYILVFL